MIDKNKICNKINKDVPAATSSKLEKLKITQNYPYRY